MAEDITSPKVAWSVLEVSQATGLSAPFLRREIKRGTLPTKRFGRRILILDSDLKTYLNKGSEGNKQRG
ncbi:MAG: helix-turn-helix domain-containing protein [Acidobacteriota bacterium]|nr:helix-turn-helix domain-containing protein [Acidobacteriota bacterium]